MTITTRTQQRSNKRIVITAVMVVLATVIALTVWHVIQIQHDAERFSQAYNKKNKAFVQLIGKLGNPLRIDATERCLNLEQGPYDNGHLWCEVSSAAYFNDVKPTAELEQKFADIIKAEGWTVTNKRRANVEFEGAIGLPCELLVDEGPLATEPGLGLSGEPEAKTTVIVSCSDRAKAKHYPYID